MLSLRSSGLIRMGAGYGASIGGAESNVAIGMARLGHQVSWSGAVGSDEQGAFVLRTLRAENVSSNMRVDEARPTGLMLIERRLGSTTKVSYYRSNSAGSSLTWEDIRGTLVDGVRVLHLSGITPALSESSHEAVTKSIELAKRLGITVSFDINYRSLLWSRARASEILGPLAAQADILIASEDELPLVFSGNSKTSVLAALAGSASIVVVKRGADGVSVTTEDGNKDIPAHRVEVRDTVGAGDAFSAGFLSGYIDGLSAEESGRRGVATAAFSVSSMGDWEGLPTRTDLEMLSLGPGETIR